MSFEDDLLVWLDQQRRLGSRPVIGLNGPVGAGKSTLALQLQQRAAAADLKLAVASIDDAYLPWQARLEAMAGNPFGVSRVPPGSHDPQALLKPIRAWRGNAEGHLHLPRFDKTLHQGVGDRVAGWSGDADALLLEGWLVGCQPIADLTSIQRLAPCRDLKAAEQAWMLRCNKALEAYQPLWAALDCLVMLWPLRWSHPLRWRIQAEARQRRTGGGWMAPAEVRQLVRASLNSLPPEVFQRPVLAKANWVRVLDGRRRALWEGSGSAAPAWLDQP
ncbi:hypothetical protein [Synechococcus sp. LA31]|uniref:hypothetical protein n=1 Tax=Synechococcus sp. LA31 TaxID=2741953 RepID=UPI001BDC5931|nr:hypothetical protein [Synechococcus sp. LA31]QVV68559.1 hypothetical protein KJJ24_05355 [Synechococcus sp. LA31]